ncbi:uncharacterized protein B0H18DRAFT_199471 [Fomitopsis serialis]|uniref:uncharacterized protein n=1 Tax=Fomitopsis serialis TaxID=139415 RepID=UPI002007931A|nr:uncharacterized protein B0H18DRAFT_199471 [Neoantrodia serialis]KAH9937484.1 hypothetical protein B0H18DRAFT_199471 [Neoantrodia serialis]
MRFATAAVLSALVSAVSAHFHLQYPSPRGPFNMQNELTFCDAYGQVTTNRTVFPLSNGYYLLTSEHPLWTLGVIISTVPDPDNFANFTDSQGNDQMAVNYFETSGEGAFCAPIDIGAANIAGVQDGSNVTIQFIFDGGDGELYQCADLTLSANMTSIPSDVSCTNATSNAGVTYFSSGVAPPTITATGTSSSATSTSTSSAADAKSVVGVSGILLSVLGGMLALA